MTLRFEILSVAIAVLLAKSTSAQTSRVSRVVVIARLSEVESGLYQVARFSLCTEALLDKGTVDLCELSLCHFYCDIHPARLDIHLFVDDASKLGERLAFGARNVFIGHVSAPPTACVSFATLERAWVPPLGPEPSSAAERFDSARFLILERIWHTADEEIASQGLSVGAPMVVSEN